MSTTSALSNRRRKHKRSSKKTPSIVLYFLVLHIFIVPLTQSDMYVTICHPEKKYSQSDFLLFLIVQ